MSAASSEQALAYVLKTESGLGYFPACYVLDKGIVVENGEQVGRHIVTDNGNWDVWFERDGSVYGEH